MSVTERNVVVHYHIFKNAGSSVDVLLKNNFPQQWVGFDGDTPGGVITTKELEKRINKSTDMIAFSSHQIVPPLPVVDARVYPIVFLRDPIDRIKSAYLFEWKKQLGLSEPKGSLVDFVKNKFAHVRKSSVEEFQTIRLSNATFGVFGAEGSDDEILDRACGFISSLDFVGIVDAFDASNELLSGYLKSAFPEFTSKEVKANVLQDVTLSNEKKRSAIKEELGDELYEMIVSRNAMDEALYLHAREHFAALCSRQFPLDQSRAA